MVHVFVCIFSWFGNEERRREEKRREGKRREEKGSQGGGLRQYDFGNFPYSDGGSYLSFIQEGRRISIN